MMLGITGGSGIYALSELVVEETRTLITPFGSPSGPITMGRIDGHPVAFVPRHGQDHTAPPHELNYRANIWALKSVGVTHLAAISAVGSLKEEIPPGEFVVVDQFIDVTRRRPLTFFDDVVVHVSIADPVCREFAALVAEASRQAGGRIHEGGTYVNIEGPQFSTRSESHWFRSMGGSVIGMTNATEARLAREAEIHFCTLAMVTDYDCWHEDEADVTVEGVLETVRKNGKVANRAIVELTRRFYSSYECRCNVCSGALTGAVMTNFAHLSPPKKERHKLLLGRFY